MLDPRIRYKTVRSDSYRFDKRETNDCSVIAVAIACDVDYKTAHTALKNAGRKYRRGATLRVILDAIENAGATIERCERHMSDRRLGYHTHDETKLDLKTTHRPWYLIWKGHKLTPNNVVKYVDRDKKYVALTKDHCFAIVDGVVMDWSKGRKHHIKSLVEVS